MLSEVDTEAENVTKENKNQEMMKMRSEIMTENKPTVTSVELSSPQGQSLFSKRIPRSIKEKIEEWRSAGWTTRPGHHASMESWI